MPSISNSAEQTTSAASGTAEAPWSLEPFSQNSAPIHTPLARGKGARVWDIEGREYIDCSSQTLNVNLGQCHPDVVEAIVDQARRLTFASSRFATEASLELHHKLVEISPASLTKVNLSSVIGGAANECAVKAARKKTGRDTVIAVKGSHHGQTAETMRISGKHWEKTYLGERHARFLPAPNCFRCPFGQRPETCHVECLSELDTIDAERDGIAAVIVEPIMVDAGVLTPPQKYHRRLRAFCDEEEIALIFDEIQTAFGWLGTMFASAYYDVVPDFMTLAKGLGAGLPLAATLLREEYDVLVRGDHEMTAGSHVLACAAALAMLRYFDQPGRLEEIARKGAYARRRFDELAERYPAIGDVRGVGLLLGLEIVDPATGAADDTYAEAIFHQLMENGVLTRVSKVGGTCSVLQFKPPVVISMDELDVVLDRFEQVLAPGS